jgi:four helix bundle protein
METNYLTLDNLDAYKLARNLSDTSWKIYEKLDWKIQKITGNQFIESTDSVGANIAEGYGRFHYLDKVKFYYNARGSLLESRHWIDLLVEREQVDKELKSEYLTIYKNLRALLNGLIKSAMKVKNLS